MTYAAIDTATMMLAPEPWDVPPELRGLAPEVLADPAAHLDPVPEVAQGQAWWPLHETDGIDAPTLDAGDRVVRVPIDAERMAEARRLAHAEMMAAGNAITARVTDAYSHAESLSWATQEAEARRIEAGEVLPPDALVPQIAVRKDRTPEEQAQRVLYRAAQFRNIVAAAVDLREEAEALLSPDLDTPAALATAVETLRARGAALADQLVPNDVATA